MGVMSVSDFFYYRANRPIGIRWDIWLLVNKPSENPFIVTSKWFISFCNWAKIAWCYCNIFLSVCWWLYFANDNFLSKGWVIFFDEFFLLLFFEKRFSTAIHDANGLNRRGNERRKKFIEWKFYCDIRKAFPHFPIQKFNDLEYEKERKMIFSFFLLGRKRFVWEPIKKVETDSFKCR